MTANELNQLWQERDRRYAIHPLRLSHREIEAVRTFRIWEARSIVGPNFGEVLEQALDWTPPK